MRRRVALLAWDQLEAVRDGAALAHPAHLFLRNQVHAELERPDSKEPAGRFYGVFGADGLETVAFFGGTRVLVIGPGPRESVVALRKLALTEERGFRILIGPREPAAALLDTLRAKVRVELDRSQPFLQIDDPARLGEIDERPRPATRADLAWLMDASLYLNEEDLGIPARTVDKKLLERRLEQRLRDRSTWVIDLEGRPACKLEVGSAGPAGALIEGVYTQPERRGRGLARHLVAAVSKRLLREFPRVGLHVGRNNTPALRAYLAAGFTEVEDLELALIGWR